MGVNWNQGLMRWKPHRNGAGEVFPLNHLHPFRFPLDLERGTVVVAAAFAMHCFTKESRPDDDPADFYEDDRERRTFCPERYQLSKGLPDLVRGLAAGSCQFAKAHLRCCLSRCLQSFIRFIAGIDDLHADRRPGGLGCDGRPADGKSRAHNHGPAHGNVHGGTPDRGRDALNLTKRNRADQRPSGLDGLEGGQMKTDHVRVCGPDILGTYELAQQ